MEPSYSRYKKSEKKISAIVLGYITFNRAGHSAAVPYNRTMFRALLTFITPFFLISCTHTHPLKDGELIDVRKTCSEYPRLVEKIMALRETNFTITEGNDPRLGDEQIWDLKKAAARRYNLDWFQLKFEKDKLKSVWMGPRSDLETDLKRLAMIPYDLLDKKGKRLETYELGTYMIKDFENRTITLDYDLAHSEGLTVTCF